MRCYRNSTNEATRVTLKLTHPTQKFTLMWKNWFTPRLNGTLCDLIKNVRKREVWSSRRSLTSIEIIFPSDEKNFAQKAELNRSDANRLQVWSLHSTPVKLIRASILWYCSRIYTHIPWVSNPYGMEYDLCIQSFFGPFVFECFLLFLVVIFVAFEHFSSTMK